MVKHLPAMQETGVRSLEGSGNPLQYLPRKFHGWRSLVGYNPWGHKESGTTEQLHFDCFFEATNWTVLNSMVTKLFKKCFEILIKF